MGTCTLCDLPTGDEPVTAADVPGSFCCQGCLVVSRRLEEADRADADTDPAATSGDMAAEDALETGADPDAVDGTEAFLAVDGMHCSTCEAFLESVATDQAGVHGAEASYPSELVRVVYDDDRTDDRAVSDALSGVGYEAAPVDEETRRGEPTERTTVGRLIVGGFFGMMTMLWYLLFLYPAYLGVDPEVLFVDLTGSTGVYLLANVWVMTTVVLGYTGYPILRGAYVSLRAGEPNMDLLVALAAVTAYVYSTLAVLAGHTEVYFDVTVVIVVAVTLGGYYERRIKERATGRLADLTADRIETARRRGAGGPEAVALDDLAPGDELVVREGERVPLDGTVVEGTATVDESLVTGEFQPVEKTAGQEVIGGARVSAGGLVVAAADGDSSTLDRITRRLWELQSGRRGVQGLADRLAGVFVPLVIVVAVVATGVHLATGTPPVGALLTGLAVLVVSCPCALGLATPLAVAAGVKQALAEGIVVTDSSVFERAPEAEVVAFDKTGTLTTGDLGLVGDYPGELLRAVAAVEQFADHPLGEAVVDTVDAPGDLTVANVERHGGSGISATVDDSELRVGTPSLFDEQDWTVPAQRREEYDTADEAGRVAALAGRDGRAETTLVATDTPRPGWEAVVSDLAEERDVVVITGDSGEAARRFEEHAAVRDVFAGVPPEAKAEIVERLRDDGPVAMVGDGSNDAPALAAADVGVAVADGSALAVDAADAVITTDDLGTVPEVFELTQATNSRIRQNLGWAFCYNGIALPVAVAGLLSPLVAAVAMAASSLLVVGNAARSLR